MSSLNIDSVIASDTGERPSCGSCVAYKQAAQRREADLVPADGVTEWQLAENGCASDHNGPQQRCRQHIGHRGSEQPRSWCAPRGCRRLACSLGEV